MEMLPHGITSNHCKRSQQQLKTATILAPLPMTAYNNNFAEKHENILSLICLDLELMDEKIDKFVSLVKFAYRTSLERQYSGFVVIDGYLIEQQCIREMYDSFVGLFLFIHLVIAMTVSLLSPQGEHVCLSSQFDNNAGGRGTWVRQ